MGFDLGQDSRVIHARELEKLSCAKAIDEINKQAHSGEQRAADESSARGSLQSGSFAKRISQIHYDRARQIVDKRIELRRLTLSEVPELGAESEFQELLTALLTGIDRVVASIPEHLKRYGFRGGEFVGRHNDIATAEMKAYARREVDILRRECALVTSKKEGRVTLGGAIDKSKVWVVHGRNIKARDAMYDFLRAIGLDPLEWGEALALTGKSTPYTGEVLDHAFERAQAVVVLITGDDMARLGTRYAEPNDPIEETELSPQARPNVLFEAGMAFGKYPERTVLVQLGKVRPFSDVFGRNVVHLTNDVKRRQGLADRLRTAGCDVKTDHKTHWHNAGDFDNAGEFADAAETSQDASNLAAFRRIELLLRHNESNTYTPEIGSSQDQEAKRLVEKGLLQPGPLGGYMLARRF